MKYLNTLIVLILFVFISSCETDSSTDINWNPEMANTLEELKAGFKEPSVDFSPAPLWVWNDNVTEEKIDFQLSEFKAHGIYMAFIHPRPGLITEYLGNEWFELVKYTVDKAKELNMKIWLYDENSYPSGFAGGHVPAATFSTSDPIAGLDMKKLDILQADDTTSYFLVIKQAVNSFINITNSRNKYYDQPGKYYGFTKWYYPKGAGWYGGFSYVDLLAYGITEKFIKTTMDGYEDYIRDEFGNAVPGIFTDEPNINTIGGPNSVMRYTPVLFNRFEKKYGYQLETYLPCLYDEIGDWKNVRHDYYALLLEMFLERWGEPWNTYTDEKNLKWTGHYWEHGWPDPKHGGDNMAMYAHHQYPGIDMLFNTDSRPDQFGNIRAVKELTSVVNQLDKARALSETYGGSGWELTFNDMKRQGDWEYVLGVNFLNPHLSHMTLKGARKRDYPQSMSYHTPWWDNYKPLNDYFRRLSFAMTSGKQVNHILILEPTSTSWMLHSPIAQKTVGSAPRAIDELKDQFHNLLTLLEKNQVEYDLGCESIIKDHGSVEGDQFVVGSRSYDLVVLPPMFENLMDSTYQLLLGYLQNGGKVLSMAGIPDRLDGNLSKPMTEQLGKYSEQWVITDKIDQNVTTQYFSQIDFKPIDPASWGGNVFHHRRMLKDGQLYFFTNYDKLETAQVSFSGKGKSVLEFDLMSGEFQTLDVEANEGMIQLTFSLPPSGSKLLIFSENMEGRNKKSLEKTAPFYAIETSQMTVKRMQPNALTLDYCDLKVEGKSYKDIYFYNAADTIFKVYLKEPYGSNYNPWSNAVQYRTRILDKNNFDSTSGFEVRYHFWVENGFLAENLKAVVESPQLYTVMINGEKVEAQPGEWWLDKDFGVFDIQSFIIDNQENTITVKANKMDILAEVEPVYLVGDFGVMPGKVGFSIGKEKKPLELGSWKAQQMPFYSHSVSYEKTFQNPAKDKVLVKLNDWAGTVAEVKVNGASAGVIGWEPYELDITDLVKEGENSVEVIVTGSLKNLMGPHHLNPEHGFVTPWSFFRAPEHQPSGAEYDMLDYGLFEDFEVMLN
jgi:hypothetical protein